MRQPRAGVERPRRNGRPPRRRLSRMEDGDSAACPLDRPRRLGPSLTCSTLCDAAGTSSATARGSNEPPSRQSPARLMTLRLSPPPARHLGRSSIPTPTNSDTGTDIRTWDEARAESGHRDPERTISKAGCAPGLWSRSGRAHEAPLCQTGTAASSGVVYLSNAHTWTRQLYVSSQDEYTYLCLPEYLRVPEGGWAVAPKSFVRSLRRAGLSQRVVEGRAGWSGRPSSQGE